MTAGAMDAQLGRALAGVKRTSLIGIDPSLTATGMVLLSVAGVPGDMPGRLKLMAKETHRTDTKMTLADRLAAIENRVSASISYMIQAAQDHGEPAPAMIVIEDPTDFGAAWTGTRLRSSSSIAKVGASFACAVIAAKRTRHAMPGVITIPTKTWLPRTKNTFMAHKDVVKHHAMLWRPLKGLPDDAMMAAAVALWYFRHPRQAAALP